MFLAEGIVGGSRICPRNEPGSAVSCQLASRGSTRVRPSHHFPFLVLCGAGLGEVRNQSLEAGSEKPGPANR